MANNINKGKTEAGPKEKKQSQKHRGAAPRNKDELAQRGGSAQTKHPRKQ